ncbi:competence type IV pilus assembly protein ComGB [Radiobacillus sp. PE A8.2]|uniref:competence type IV pilus assembly protein ComGB n=1 Tax=Radiobacillus sp. PE A8.2 TaxID=3380349 RepID=UPI00388E4FF9
MDLSSKNVRSLFSNTRLSLNDQALFLQRLARFIENGYSLLDALHMLAWEKRWANHANLTSQKLQEGFTLDQALIDVGFHDKVISYLFFARYNGDLEASLKHCSTMIQRQTDHTNQIKQSLRYPLVLFILFCVLLYFVKNSLYPSFSMLFTEQSAFTRVAMTVIDTLFQGLTFLLISVPVGFGLWWVITRYFQISKQIAIVNKLPIVRRYLSLHISGLFAVHLSSLLASGMPIKESLHTVKNQSRLPILSYYASVIISELERGVALSKIFPSLLLFEKELTFIFQKNANTEVLEKDLQMYAESLMEQLQKRIKRLISLIQPVFFLLMAGLIIFVYLSLILPTFQLINTI